MNDGPAAITFFCRTLSEFSWAWLFSEGALRATLGFVVERLRRIRAVHTEQHRTRKKASVYAVTLAFSCLEGKLHCSVMLPRA